MKQTSEEIRRRSEHIYSNGVQKNDARAIKRANKLARKAREIEQKEMYRKENK